VTDYLDSTFNLDAASGIAAYDELPLWSAMAGLLLLEHVPMRSWVRVLDVGFGTGFPLLELAQRLGRETTAVGIDPWRPATLRARDKRRAYAVHNAHLVTGDAAALPFAKSCFDLIVSNLGLNNFEDAGGAIQECARVLRPDGTVAITTNLVGHMREFYEVFAATLLSLALEPEQRALQRHINHRAAIEGVRDLFGSCDLVVTRIEMTEISMRFASGSALLRHHFIRLGFLDAWKGVVGEGDRPRVFALLEKNLNVIADREGELHLTIPLAYIEAAKA
jgi:SAM-dependent methyltransferase